MASIKERRRWDAMFNAQARRMERQREMLTRAMLIHTEFSAALLEIAHMETGHDSVLDFAIERAQEAIAKMSDPAAALGPTVEESDRQFETEMEAAQDG